MDSLSEFTQLWQPASDLLGAFHGVVVLFLQDETVTSSPWRSIRVQKFESNVGETDRGARLIGAQMERIAGSFLIERKFLETDASGRTIEPGERSVIQHQGYVWRASSRMDRPVCVPEDHEGLILRFHTTRHEAVE